MNKIISKLAKTVGVVKKKDTGGDLNFFDCGDVSIIIDIGVAQGTPWLYQAYKDTSFILIDPLPIDRSCIEEYLSPHQYTIIEKGVSDEKGKLSMNVDTVASSLSSFYDRTELSDRGHNLKRKVVEVDTLDQILSNIIDKNSRAGVKIDVEGYELKALKGGINFLSQVDWIVAEVSTAVRFSDGYNFSELISFLYEQGFVVERILRAPASKEGHIRTADILFTRLKN